MSDLGSSLHLLCPDPWQTFLAELFPDPLAVSWQVGHLAFVVPDWSLTHSFLCGKFYGSKSAPALCLIPCSLFKHSASSLSLQTSISPFLFLVQTLSFLSAFYLGFISFVCESGFFSPPYSLDTTEGNGCPSEQRPNTGSCSQFYCPARTWHGGFRGNSHRKHQSLSRSPACSLLNPAVSLGYR